MQVDPGAVPTVIQVNVTAAIFIMGGNLLAVVFACGILYNQVKVVNDRVGRLERLVDTMIVALVEKLGKNYGR